MNHEEHKGKQKRGRSLLAARPSSCSSCPSWWTLLLFIGLKPPSIRRRLTNLTV